MKGDNEMDKRKYCEMVNELGYMGKKQLKGPKKKIRDIEEDAEALMRLYGSAEEAEKRAGGKQGWLTEIFSDDSYTVNVIRGTKGNIMGTITKKQRGGKYRYTLRIMTSEKRKEVTFSGVEEGYIFDGFYFSTHSAGWYIHQRNTDTLSKEEKGWMDAVVAYFLDGFSDYESRVYQRLEGLYRKMKEESAWG